MLQRGGLLGRTEWVVPRAELLHRRLDLNSLPPRQRKAAAHIALMRERPTADAAERLAWTNGGIAHAWLWSPPGDVAAAIAQGGNWLPETLLQRPPTEDGMRLVNQLDGVEGQVWQGGALLASQWWPQRPTLADWHRFVRSSGRMAAEYETVPFAQDIPLSRPWARVARRGGRATGSERWAWRALAGSLAFAFALQYHALADARRLRDEVLLSTDALRARAQPLIQARESAEAARVDLERYGQLRDAHDDYALMAQVIGSLDEEARLLGWERQKDSLKVIVNAGWTDPRKYVEAYAGHPRLGRVRVEPSATGRAMLTFDLPPTRREDPER